MKLNNQNKSVFVQNVFNQVFNKYDLMNDIMSLGVHRFWKKQFINWLAPLNNKKLLDMACGSGDIVKLFINYTKNNCQIDAIDANTKMISIGKKRLKNYKNINWNIGNAEKLKFKDNTFDYYTISFGIRNVSNINKALSEAFRVLKPGGRFMCLEFSKIQNSHLDKIYQLYSKNISAFILHGYDQEKKEFNLEDDIMSGSMFTHQGKIVDERTKSSIEGGN